MEHTSKKVKDLISKIIPLMETGNEDYWLRYFKYIMERFDSDDDKEVIISLSQIFKGGMGSFSDIVLHKNGVPLIAENNQLDALKDQLFDACEEAIRN
jgi:hypothetical protein